MTIPDEGRVMAYIDGHNMYHGMKTRGYGRYLWLDYRKLITGRLRGGQRLIDLRYFTTTVNAPADRRERHLRYLRALQEHSGIAPIEGFFQAAAIKCTRCSQTFRRPIEKQTDVALGVQMVVDAFHDEFDIAFLVCGDSDLVPAVSAVRARGKQVVVWSPPKRKSDELVAHADAHLHFSRAALAQSQLPNPVSTKKGKELWRPPTWS